MTCVDFRERLVAYADGEDGSPLEVERHVAGCPSCAAELEELRRDGALLDRALAPVAERADAAAERALASLPPDPALRRSGGAPWWTVVLAAAASFLLAVALVKGPSVVPEGITGSAPVAARLRQATGPLELRAPGGQWEPMPTGAAIPAGSAIRTAALARAEIRLESGALLCLNGSTTVNVLDSANCQVVLGELWTRAADMEPATFVLTAGDNRFSSKGAEYVVYFTEAESHLTALAGEVSVQSQIADSTLRASETLYLGTQVCRVDPEPATMAKLTWVRDLGVEPSSPEEALRQEVAVLLSDTGCAAGFAEPRLKEVGDRAVAPVADWIRANDAVQKAHGRRLGARILRDLAARKDATKLVELLRDVDEEVRVEANRGLVRIFGVEIATEDAARAGGEKACGQWRGYVDRKK